MQLVTPRLLRSVLLPCRAFFKVSLWLEFVFATLEGSNFCVFFPIFNDCFGLHLFATLEGSRNVFLKIFWASIFVPFLDFSEERYKKFKRAILKKKISQHFKMLKM